MDITCLREADMLAYVFLSFGAVAQRLEPRTHNPLVTGSNPVCPIFIKLSF